MKKGLVIFGSILALVSTGLCVVVTVALSKTPKHFVSPTGEREWARQGFESLFVTPTYPLPQLSSEPPIVRKMARTKNKVEFTFTKLTGVQDNLTRFGTRIDPVLGKTTVKLADGNTLRFLGVATYLPDELHERHLNVKRNLIWHDPSTLDPLDVATANKLNLESTTRLPLSERSIIFAFDVLNPDLPHYWQSLNLRNADTLCGIHSTSRSQTRAKVRYYSLELGIYHPANLMLMVSISHGKPETKTIDLASLPLNKPVFFDSGNVQLTVPFKTNGSQSSHSFGNNGTETKIGFRWSDIPTSYQQSFAIIDCGPPVLANQIQWRTKSLPTKDKNYWSGISGHQGLSKLDFQKKLAELEPLEVRFLPEVSHVVFRLDSIPNLDESENLFEINSGPIRFNHSYDARRFLNLATQTQSHWNGKIWPDSSYPLEFDNITPAELITKAELINGIQLKVDSNTYEITERNSKPLFERLSDWLKLLF